MNESDQSMRQYRTLNAELTRKNCELRLSVFDLQHKNNVISDQLLQSRAETADLRATIFKYVQENGRNLQELLTAVNQNSNRQTIATVRPIMSESIGNSSTLNPIPVATGNATNPSNRSNRTLRSPLRINEMERLVDITETATNTDPSHLEGPVLFGQLGRISERSNENDTSLQNVSVTERQRKRSTRKTINKRRQNIRDITNFRMSFVETDHDDSFSDHNNSDQLNKTHPDPIDDFDMPSYNSAMSDAASSSTPYMTTGQIFSPTRRRRRSIRQIRQPDLLTESNSVAEDTDSEIVVVKPRRQRKVNKISSDSESETCDVTNGRPRRKAAPQRIAEPSLRTKLRRKPE